MAQEVLIYSFEDADGDPETDWTTTEYGEAKRYALDNQCRLVENTYRWYDSVTLEDYCPEEEDEEDEDYIPDEEIQAHIDAGAKVLTEHFGDAATWANRVPIGGTDGRYLDIDSPCNCVVHHVFKDEPLLTDEERQRHQYDSGRYVLGLSRLALDGTAEDYGFCAVDDEGERLTDMWRETIFNLQTCN